MLALEAVDLVKTYHGRDGPVRALNGVSLRVPRGALFGFLGPNGAGKTTLMRMIHAAFPPTSGRLEVLGLDVAAHPSRVKARLGVAPQENNLDPDFTVLKNLTVYARFFDLPRATATRRAHELLRFVGLEDKAKSAVDELSGGMKRRLVLARALLNEPDLVILDEPTTGLDPQSRHLVWDKVRELRRRGITILLTTHYMDEAERLCDELVIVDGGRVLERGSPPELVAKHASADVLELTFEGPARQQEARIRRLPGVGSARIEFVGERAIAYVSDAGGVLTAAKGVLPRHEALVRRGGLEDVFLHLTGRGLRE